MKHESRGILDALLEPAIVRRDPVAGRDVNRISRIHPLEHQRGVGAAEAE